MCESARRSFSRTCHSTLIHVAMLIYHPGPDTRRSGVGTVVHRRCVTGWTIGRYACPRPPTWPEVPMRILMTGGSGVLGRTSMPLLRRAGHQIDAPRHDQLDLYDSRAITAAARGTDAILHLASNTPPPEARGTRDAWAANDRLRRDATGLLVDVALATGVECFVF